MCPAVSSLDLGQAAAAWDVEQVPMLVLQEMPSALLPHAPSSPRRSVSSLPRDEGACLSGTPYFGEHTAHLSARSPRMQRIRISQKPKWRRRPAVFGSTAKPAVSPSVRPESDDSSSCSSSDAFNPSSTKWRTPWMNKAAEMQQMHQSSQMIDLKRTRCHIGRGASCVLLSKVKMPA